MGTTSPSLHVSFPKVSLPPRAQEGLCGRVRLAPACALSEPEGNGCGFDRVLCTAQSSATTGTRLSTAATLFFLKAMSVRVTGLRSLLPGALFGFRARDYAVSE